MKGDLLLLGAVGAAMVAVPAAVLIWSGQPLAADFSKMTLPVSAVNRLSQRSEGGESSSSDPQVADSPEADGGVPVMEEEPALPDTVKERWASPIDTLRIYDQGTGQVAEMTLAEYTRCAIAAEMPADNHLEALKAQGVAALTYAIRQAIEQRSLPEDARDPALHGADFAADFKNNRGCMTEENAREFYGERFDYSWNKITQAAAVACKCVALWEGEPIAAAYHAISAGETTERSENIWQTALPYLVEVDSSWDILAPGYKSTVTIADGEMEELLTSAGATLLPDASTWLEIEERSKAGYVTAIRAGSVTLHGNQLRNLLGLRSAAFELERSYSGYTFYVRGYGHGAGLSQAGADYLARQGQGFDEILLHYYTGVTLAQIVTAE